MRIITATALKHPKTQDAILDGLIQANQVAAMSTASCGSAYVTNSKGNPMFRIDVFHNLDGKEIRMWRGNADMTKAVTAAVGLSVAELVGML